MRCPVTQSRKRWNSWKANRPKKPALALFFGRLFPASGGPVGGVNPPLAAAPRVPMTDTESTDLEQQMDMIAELSEHALAELATGELDELENTLQEIHDRSH